MRAIGALEVIGENDHVPALEKVSQNKKLEPIIRQAAERAIRQIEKRASEKSKGSNGGIKRGHRSNGDTHKLQLSLLMAKLIAIAKERVREILGTINNIILLAID